MPRLRLPALVVYAAAVLCPATARSDEEITLRVGEKVDFAPGAQPSGIVCDDLTIISVADGGSYLVITGLKPGATTCSVALTTMPGLRKVYRFSVVP
jgi:hypothetical protein